MRHRRPGQVAAGGVEHALGLAGRARGVEDEQRVLRAHFRGRAVGRGEFTLVMPPIVAAFLDMDPVFGMADDEHRFHRRAVLQRLVDIGLERDQLAAAHAAVGGNDDPAVAVLDAAGQRLGRKAAKHHRMDRADPRAGKHRHGRLGDHRHVDRHPVALPGAETLQRIGEAADLLVQLAVGEPALLRRIVAFPDDRDRVAACRQVPVEAIGRDVERAIREPADAEIRFIVGAGRQLGPRPDPIDPRALLAPESLGLLDRAAVFLGMAGGIDIGAARPFGGDGMDGGHETALQIPRTRIT